MKEKYTDYKSENKSLILLKAIPKLYYHNYITNDLLKNNIESDFPNNDLNIDDIYKDIETKNVNLYITKIKDIWKTYIPKSYFITIPINCSASITCH